MSEHSPYNPTSEFRPAFRATQETATSGEINKTPEDIQVEDHINLLVLERNKAENARNTEKSRAKNIWDMMFSGRTTTDWSTDYNNAKVRVDEFSRKILSLDEQINSLTAQLSYKK